MPKEVSVELIKNKTKTDDLSKIKKLNLWG